MLTVPEGKRCQVPLVDISSPQEDTSVAMRTQHVNRQQAHSKVFIPAGSRHRYINLLQLDMHRYFSLTNSSLHMSLQVLAMARPWQENLLKHNIPQAFQDAGIGMVLNLQVASWQLLLPSIKLYIALRLCHRKLGKLHTDQNICHRKLGSMHIVAEAFCHPAASAMTLRPSWPLALACSTSAGETWASLPCRR